jgi:tRNA modification GTPase
MEQLEAIPWVVLTGPTNAGKSTLFNSLLGHERAVVSDVAGTTRDVLIEPLSIRVRDRNCEVMLVDLAGDDDDPATINRLMQAAADDARARAELVLYCAPVDEAEPTGLPHRRRRLS